jgi:repressor LexA
LFVFDKFLWYYLHKLLKGDHAVEKLSKRQAQIYTFLKEHVREKGYPPSVRDIGEAVGLASSSTVHGHLERLERKGLIRRDPTKPRAIEIFEIQEEAEGIRQSDAYFAPIIGKVTAGLPITALENIDGYFPLPTQYSIYEGNLFILEVYGDSMIEAGILNGDYIVVKKQNTAINGEIVVAMTEEDEATVKRFYKEKTHFRLQPENSAMAPILVDSVTILGKVIGVFRHLD